MKEQKNLGVDVLIVDNIIRAGRKQKASAQVVV